MLRHFGLRPAGGNYRLLRRWLDEWDISIEHFSSARRRRRRASAIAARGGARRAARPISRGHLKQRLYDEGLKQRECELCGQGEEWRGRRMSLILDHINGVADDNRLENLRIVCPNCAATLDTHCGRAEPQPGRGARVPALRRERSAPKYRRQRYCSRTCGMRCDRARAAAAGRAAGGAAAVRAVGGGGGGDELDGGRAQVRRERQRGAQVGAGV